MTIEKRIKLKNNIYYISVEVEYVKDTNGFTQLCLKNYQNNYYDGGDFSLLISKIEKNYDEVEAQKYDKEIGFMADVLYLYDRIPFFNAVKDCCIKNNILCSSCLISKIEIDNYMKTHNINPFEKNNFKLSDERTWKI